ncbi:MAG: hypothetical protein HZA61_11595 [Candidatus Eisenbacteria bacterium]|uniref:Uncharacterized protein n=1 Tax=Eiseniibacteriota bacterium TaxID=2212470 RepID=A0A933W2J2_UNCEI|nr:hypothetical protein [Candidatus Eisenbacteria bacterium]
MTTLAILDDLFFVARLQGTARSCGATLEIAPSARALERFAETAPARVLVDLHAPLDLAALVAGIRASGNGSHVRITGFYSHVDGETRRRALAAGIDEAMPRSVFVGKLPELLTRAPGSTNETETHS